MTELMHALNLKPKDRPLALGYLELLWHFTAEFAPRGDIGRYKNNMIEAALDWYGKPGRLVEALTTARWVEVRENTTEGRVLVVHDWHDHCDDSTRKRLARSHESFVSLEGNLTGLRRDVSGQRRTTADNGSLPEPSLASPMPPPPREDGQTPVNGHGRRRREYPDLTNTKAEIGKNFPDVRDAFLHRGD